MVEVACILSLNESWKLALSIRLHWVRFEATCHVKTVYYFRLAACHLPASALKLASKGLTESHVTTRQESSRWTLYDEWLCKSSFSLRSWIGENDSHPTRNRSRALMTLRLTRQDLCQVFLVPNWRTLWITVKILLPFSQWPTSQNADVRNRTFRRHLQHLQTRQGRDQTHRHNEFVLANNLFFPQLTTLTP